MIYIYRARPEQYPVLQRNLTRCQLVDTCLDVTITQSYSLHTNFREIGSENKYSYFFPKKDNARVYMFKTEYLDEDENLLLELDSVVQEKQEAKESALEAAENGYTAQVMEINGSNYEVQLMNPPEDCKNVILTVRYSQNVEFIDTMHKLLKFEAPLLTLLDSNDKLPPQKFRNFPEVSNDAIFEFTLFIRSFSTILDFKSTSHKDLDVVKEDDMTYIVSFKENEPLTWRKKTQLGPVKMKLEIAKELSCTSFVQDPSLLPSIDTFKETFGENTKPVKLSLSVPPQIESRKADDKIRNFMFVVDRSDSMQGDAIINCRKALNLLLSSLPLGSTFNLCSFGSHHSFLFGKGFREYNKENLTRARELVNRMGAVFGGTKLLEPLKKVIKMHENQLKISPNSETVVFLLTDGEVRDTKEVIKVVSDGVSKVKDKWSLRFFTLGIGEDVSKELVENVALQGGGSSIFLMKDERMNKAVARQLSEVSYYPLGGFELKLNPKLAKFSKNKLLGPLLRDSLAGKSAYPASVIGYGYDMIEFYEEFYDLRPSDVIGTLVANKTGVKGETLQLAELTKDDFNFVETNFFGELVDKELKILEKESKVTKSAKKRITKLAICANIPCEYTSLVSISKTKTNDATEEDRVLPPIQAVIYRRPYYAHRAHQFNIKLGMMPVADYSLGGSAKSGAPFTRRIKKRGKGGKGPMLKTKKKKVRSAAVRASSREKLENGGLSIPPPVPAQTLSLLEQNTSLKMEVEEDLGSMSDDESAGGDGIEMTSLQVEQKADISEVAAPVEIETFDFDMVDEEEEEEIEEKEVEEKKDLTELYNKLDRIVTLQAPTGSFEVDAQGIEELSRIMEIEVTERKQGLWTALVIIFLETRLEELEDEWEMVHKKAHAFLSILGHNPDDLLAQATKLLE